MDAACTFCGCDVLDHDPVFVTTGPEREPAGQFCNYACLAQHIEAEGLETGATCRLETT